MKNKGHFGSFIEKCCFSLPTVLLPKLTDLIFSEYQTDTSLAELRWSLIFWILDITDEHKITSIKQLPEKYIVPVLTLTYLVQVNSSGNPDMCEQ